MNKKSQFTPLSRRSFLKTAGVLGAGAGLAGAMPAFAKGSRALQDQLDMSLWWWADEPAFGAWVDDTIQAYTAEHPGVNVEALQQDTCCVISQFTTAAAAGEPPDIAFLFNGLYHMENVWLGYLDPLDDLIPAEMLAQSNATALSRYDGKQYRIGWYPVPMIWEYNKDVWDQAGLDADNPPTTWDDWMAACETLKTAGFTPMGGGISDGFWGEWYLGHALIQSLNSPGEAIELFIGDKDFRDPQYYEFWSKLEEMVKAGYMNDDMLSIDLFTAINKVVTGEIATTQNVGAVIPSHIAQIGDRVGLMVMPTFGQGPLAGIPITDSQGFGIPTATEHKAEAADFLMYMQSPDRLNAFWEINHYFPSNTSWDASAIDDPVLQQLWDVWVGAKTNVYVPNLMPGLFWTDAMFVASQEIIAGNMTGEQAGEQNAGVAEQWRALNPDLVENYRIYAQGLAEAPAEDLEISATEES
jgi:raffinose/stachyose/melibiose transport system substrate-binding protein